MKDANKNTVTDEMYPLRIQGAASCAAAADGARRSKPQFCGLTLPDHVDAAAIQILALPVDDRLTAAAHREQQQVATKLESPMKENA